VHEKNSGKLPFGHEWSETVVATTGDQISGLGRGGRAARFGSSGDAAITPETGTPVYA